MSVASTHPDYEKFAPKWKRVRDCGAGQDAIHAAGEAYLPRLKDEDEKDYRARIQRSDFFNATWRTIAGLAGMAFRKPPTAKVPGGIEPYLEDIDLAGLPMEGLARGALDELLSTGRIFILVDHPTPPDNVQPLTIAASEALGLRPTIQTYPAESLINWKFGRVNNAWVMTMAVLRERELVAVDEFESKAEDRWRVLDLLDGVYRQRLYRKKAAGEQGDDYVQIGTDIYPLMNGRRLTRIPGAIVGPDGRGDQIDEPPLNDLVDKNLAHYQVNADYRHGLHFTGLPTLFLSGITTEDGGKKDFYIGSTAAITSPHPDAKGMFIEFTGQGLGAIEKALTRLETQMALLGARMIADESKQAETLGATQIKRQGENSVLARIVQSTSEALEWALGIFAEWAGHPGDVVYQINRDFLPAGMDAPQLKALLAAVQAGELSSESFFDLLQRADLVASDVTFEEERERIDSAGPPRPATVRQPSSESQAA